MFQQNSSAKKKEETDSEASTGEICRVTSEDDVAIGDDSKKRRTLNSAFTKKSANLQNNLNSKLA